MMPVELRSKAGPVAFAIVDDKDFDSVSIHKWHLNPYGYAACKIGKKTILMHRLIMVVQSGLDVDHRNHLKLDNRRCNLRICTRSENNRNRLPTIGRTLPCGVYKSPCGYYAQITISYKTINLGNYKTLQEADCARRSAEDAHFGEFKLSHKGTK